MLVLIKGRSLTCNFSFFYVETFCKWVLTHMTPSHKNYKQFVSGKVRKSKFLKDPQLVIDVTLGAKNKSHYNNRGLFCDPNIIANNKERCFRNPAVANHNSLQTLKLLRYHNISTRTIASPSQLPNLIQSQNFSDYNCFYPLFAINITSETICSKPITATT
jgi:hypothetical protein